jgi:hypothetical protein
MLKEAFVGLFTDDITRCAVQTSRCYHGILTPYAHVFDGMEFGIILVLFK